MKTIKNVIYDKGKEIEIDHIDGFLRIEDSENNNYKGLKSYTSISQKDKENFNHYDSYSKDELIKFQNVLLKAYVFLNDQLDDAIENSESKKVLDEIKGKVIITRKHLRFITNHIDTYEELLKNYKEI